MKNKRIGKIYISAPLMYDMDIDEMLKVTSKLVVIRCEHLYHKDSFEYIAICQEFDEIEQECEPPTYLVEIKKEITEEGMPPEIIGIKFIRQD